MNSVSSFSIHITTQRGKIGSQVCALRHFLMTAAYWAWHTSVLLSLLTIIQERTKCFKMSEICTYAHHVQISEKSYGFCCRNKGLITGSLKHKFMIFSRKKVSLKHCSAYSSPFFSWSDTLCSCMFFKIMCRLFTVLPWVERILKLLFRSFSAVQMHTQYFYFPFLILTLTLSDKFQTGVYNFDKSFIFEKKSLYSSSTLSVAAEIN